MLDKTIAGKGAGGARAKPIRLNVVLSKEDKSRIDRLVEEMGAETVTDVIKDSLRLIEFIIGRSSSGSKFFIKEPGGDVTQLEIFGVTTK